MPLWPEDTNKESMSPEPKDLRVMSIDLKPLVNEDETKFIKYVTFDGIRKDSYLRIHDKEMDERLKKRGV